MNAKQQNTAFERTAAEIKRGEVLFNFTSQIFALDSAVVKIQNWFELIGW